MHKNFSKRNFVYTAIDEPEKVLLYFGAGNRPRNSSLEVSIFVGTVGNLQSRTGRTAIVLQDPTPIEGLIAVECYLERLRDISRSIIANNCVHFVGLMSRLIRGAEKGAIQEAYMKYDYIQTQSKLAASALVLKFEECLNICPNLLPKLISAENSALAAFFETGAWNIDCHTRERFVSRLCRFMQSAKDGHG